MVANAVGSLYGGATFVAMSALMNSFIVVRIVVATALAAAVLASFQGVILRRCFPALRRVSFVLSTLVGASLGSALGVVLAVTLRPGGEMGTSSGLLFGVVFGSVVGGAQAIALREHLRTVGRSSVSWVISQGLGYAVVSLWLLVPKILPEEVAGPEGEMALAGLLVIAALIFSGLTLGGISSVPLLRMPAKEVARRSQRGATPPRASTGCAP